MGSGSFGNQLKNQDEVPNSRLIAFRNFIEIVGFSNCF